MQLSKLQRLFLRADLADCAVLDSIRLAAEHSLACMLVDIRAVHHSDKGMAVAVTVGDIFIQALAVQPVMPRLLVVGQEHEARKAKARRKAHKIRVNGLAGFLRLDVDSLRAVHRACADAHDDAGIALHELPEADALKELQLCGHMTAGQHHHVRQGDQPGSVALVARVKHHGFTDGQVMVVKRIVERFAHLVVEGVVVRAGGDDDHARIGLMASGQPVHKAVGPVKDTGQLHARGDVVVTGAAGQKQVHSKILSERKPQSAGWDLTRPCGHPPHRGGFYTCCKKTFPYGEGGSPKG